MNEQPINDARQTTSASFPHRSTITSTFSFAVAGLAYLLRTQRNARIHLFAAIVALAMAAWLGLARIEWAVLILTITVVFVLEGINTAIEAVVDLASPEIHPLAKIAKDVSAAMVLVAAGGSAIIGVLLFGPPLLQHLHR